MEIVRTSKSNNFVGIDLLAVDKSKLPQALSCVVSDVSESVNQEIAQTKHYYYSDQPSYDHTRDG